VSLDAASVELLAAAINAHLVGGGLAVVATHVPMALQPLQTLRLGRREARS
jgi:heme exporter protein A